MRPRPRLTIGLAICWLLVNHADADDEVGPAERQEEKCLHMSTLLDSAYSFSTL